MFIETEGIVLRQIKIAGGRKMLLLFSRRYGKISVGSSISEKGRSKASLALRPFTFGRYELYKNKEYYNLNSAETKRSFYGIGENVDKYMCASYALEFTEKLLEEEQPNPQLFDLLIEFFAMLEERKSKFTTLLIGYQVKAMAILGAAPELRACTECGKTEGKMYLSVADGGLICSACRSEKYGDNNSPASLIFSAEKGIIDTLYFFLINPLKSLEKIGLTDEVEAVLRKFLRAYAEYHFDVHNLKSEGFFA